MVTDNKPSLVTINVDGVEHQVPAGANLVDALGKIGKEVPHYCYHPKLPVAGNCRMCLVELGSPMRDRATNEVVMENGKPKIGWQPKPAIACATNVSPGLHVRLESPGVKACREGVTEMLLLNHPLDCPICDQAGECKLQEFSAEYGRGYSRYLDEKNAKPKKTRLGPRVTLDDERCILCSRCVRFSSEIAKDPVLGFVNRGSFNTLTCFPGRELDNNYSLNTVDICPVGALTSTDFRFQQRVWFLTETPSICTGCGRGCNMEIGARGDTIYRQTPRDNNDVNSTWMCDSGRLDFHFVNSEFRLTDPMVKTAGKHQIANWKTALSTTAEALRGLKGSEIAIIASGRLTNEELFFVKHLAKQLGTENVDIIPRTGGADNYLRADDLNPNTNGAKLILGIEPGSKLAQIQENMSRGLIRGVLALGENLLKVGFAQRDLEKVPFIATLHLLANASAELSHVVLPGTAYAEKRGSMINVTGRLQRLNKAVKAPGNARDTWEILRDLIVALGGSNGLHSVDDVFKRLTAEVPALNGLTFSKIGDLGTQVIETQEKIPLLEREKERKAKGIIVG